MESSMYVRGTYRVVRVGSTTTVHNFGLVLRQETYETVAEAIAEFGSICQWVEYLLKVEQTGGEE